MTKSAFEETTHSKIHGLSVKINRVSSYPIPWNGSKENRPSDYFEKIKTTITYTENNREVEITVPVAVGDQNRKRVLKIKVDGKNYPLSKAGQDILDMNQTFDIPEMYKLINIALSSPGGSQSNTDKTLKTCLPFFYMNEANYTLPKEKIDKKNPDGHLNTSNGNIKKLVLPYLSAMKRYNDRGIKRELYIPVTMLGDPHHWNLCIITIDENNKPSLTYLESSSSGKMSEYYVSFYKKNILPGLNEALQTNKYSAIHANDIIFDVSKQFSQKGCGIATSINLQNLLNGRLKIKGDKVSNLINNPVPQQYTGLSIEEDAIRRVQLALHITAHEKQLSAINIPQEHQNKMGTVLRELKTHKNSLRVNADETFPLLNKKEWLNKLHLEFKVLLDQLHNQTRNCIQKGDKNSPNFNPEYSKISLDARNLNEHLKEAVTIFFTSPTPENFQKFKENCQQVINTAEKKFKNYRDFWSRVDPTLKAILGIITILTIIPFLLIWATSTRSFTSIFFSQPLPDLAKKIQPFKKKVIGENGVMDEIQAAALSNNSSSKSSKP